MFGSKKNIFYILISVILLLGVFIAVFSFLGNIEREGYISNFDLIEENNSDNYIYNIRMNYYDKVFRRSDVYKLYPDTSNLPDYIVSINWQYAGSAWGKIESTKELSDNDKIEVPYRLKVEIVFYKLLVLALLIIFIVYSIPKKLPISNKTTTIKLSTIIFMGYLYLGVPYLIFVLGWLKLILALPIAILMCYIFYLLYKDAKNNYNEFIEIDKKLLYILTIVMILLPLVLGVVGIFPQDNDMIYGRNSMFKDLVNFSWPLIYPENNHGVIYYIAHWMVPALFGKLLGFNVGLLALLLWSSFGLVLVLLLSISYIKPNINAFYSVLIITFIVITFSMDKLFRYNFSNGILLEYGYNWMAISALSNQAIGVWVMSSLFLHQKNTRNFAFLGLSTVFYSPYSIIAIIPFMVVKLIGDIKEKFIMSNIFSLGNILASIIIFPVLLIFFKSHSTTSDGFKMLFDKVRTFPLLLIYLWSFGLYVILTFRCFGKNKYYLVCIFEFITFSLVQYSNDHNFTKVFICTSFIFMMFLIKFLLETEFNFDKKRKVIVAILVLTSSMSALDKISNGIIHFVVNGPTEMIFNNYNDKEKTSDNYWVLKTWATKNPEETFFFKNLAKTTDVSKYKDKR